MTTYIKSEDDGRAVDDENGLPAIPDYPFGWNAHKMELLHNAAIKLKEEEYINIYGNHKRTELAGYVFDDRTRYCALKKREKEFKEFIEFLQVRETILWQRRYIKRMRRLREL